MEMKLPLCCVNPKTEKPYSRHKWEIVQGRIVQKDGDPLFYHHVVCSRIQCQLNNPNPVQY